MGLVVTVTANAALDRTLFVDELRPGRRQRVVADHAQAGGKGVNVSRVLVALGWGVRTIVVLGGETGHAIERDLEAAALEPVVVSCDGESRTCLEIVESKDGTLTQLHGAGVRATSETASALIEAVESSLDAADWLALCGSLPDGCPEDTYARLVNSARRRGVRVALDASGPELVAGWSASPDLLRINREEAAAAIGSYDADDLKLPPRQAPGSARLSVVSDGQRAAWAWAEVGNVWRIEPPAVRLRSPLGCGDAMLAGLLATLDAGPVAASLRFATAVGAAAAESDVAGRADPSRARELAPSVSVELA